MWKKKCSWRWFNVMSCDLPWMTEEKFGNASEITGFAVKFWNINFPKKNYICFRQGSCEICGQMTTWLKREMLESLVSRLECIMWRKAYPICNRCMMPGREWAEPTEQKMRFFPLCPDRPEINCTIVLLCSELGFYFTCTELVTKQGHRQIIDEICK